MFRFRTHAWSFLILTTVLPCKALATDAFSLRLRVEELTAALIDNRPRDIYPLFVSAFQNEVSYAKFESSYVRWLAGRRLVKARPKVVDVRGPTGHVSTYLVFAGRDEYSYVYQAWLNDGGVWRLAWLSGILEPGMRYGHPDSVQNAAVARAALEYLFAESAPQAGTTRRRGRRTTAMPRITLELPDTLVMLFDSIQLPLSEVAGRHVVWITSEQLTAAAKHRPADAVHIPDVPFVCVIPSIRIFGNLAQIAIDFRPGPAQQPSDALHGVELYLARTDSGWRFHSLGRSY